MPYISLSWLREHVNVPADKTIEELAQDLVSVGLEEEEIHPPSVTGPLVAGRVLTLVKETHSNGKTVNYCRVDVGPYNDEPGQGKEKSDLPSRGIICGAHNFEEGDYVVVALPGAVLPGPFPIAARKTYGHISDGMICSERELGLGEDHNGIIVLDEPVEPGTDMIPRLGLGEEVLEINVTPDRGYCFSVRGIAREYSHSTGAHFIDPGVVEASVTHSDDAFAVEVEDPLACDRFVTRVVRGIAPDAQSPQWMVERLGQAGMRSISLPVDVTNYVMLDLGQPLHAYALESVAEPFVVRRARAGELFTTLDGVERKLDGEDIVIADSPGGKTGSRLVGLAGTMGGLDSEISSGTTDVVIEAAHFDAVSIARTSRRHKLSSEASKRFERGVDPLLPEAAVQRVVDLLVEYGGGVADPHVFDYNHVVPLPVISMKLSEPERLTGVSFTKERIVEILTEIGAEVRFDGDNVIIQPPSWRPDLVGPAHVVEEIARIDGYDKIDTNAPRVGTGQGLKRDQWALRRVVDTAAQRGLTEVLSYPFVGNAHDRQLIAEGDVRRNALRLRNPLAEDAPLLRTSLLDTLLETAERNCARGASALAIYESGRVTLPGNIIPTNIPGADRRPDDETLQDLYNGVPHQPLHLAAVIGGSLGPTDVLTPGRQWDWADAISLGQKIGSALGVKVEASRSWLPADTPKVPGPPVPVPTNGPDQVAPWHPGRAATLFVRHGKNIIVLGRAGELHPRVVEEYGLLPRSSAVEIDLEELFKALPNAEVKAKKVSSYPPAKTDLAIVTDSHVTAADVERVVRSASGTILENIQLFDVYVGSPVPAGKKSLAFALTLRAPDHTLSPDEVTAVRQKIIGDLGKRLKAELRA